MFTAVVDLEAQIGNTEFTFPCVEFNACVPEVRNAEIEGASGREVRIKVELGPIPTQELGLTIARQVAADALNRISFHKLVSISQPFIKDTHFESLDSSSGSSGATLGLQISGSASAWLGFSAEDLRVKLEEVTPAGEPYFSMFAAAFRSKSPVEKYMHLYNIILMLCLDEQKFVDSFIMNRMPHAPYEPQPIFGSANNRRAPRNETIFTRLRNELGHRRPGVDIELTKSNMEQWVDELARLTKLAIERGPVGDNEEYVEYLAVVEKTDLGFAVSVPDMPECCAEGETYSQAARKIRTAIKGHLEDLARRGMVAPDPHSSGLLVSPNV